MEEIKNLEILLIAEVKSMRTVIHTGLASQVPQEPIGALVVFPCKNWRKEREAMVCNGPHLFIMPAAN